MKNKTNQKSVKKTAVSSPSKKSAKNSVSTKVVKKSAKSLPVIKSTVKNVVTAPAKKTIYKKVCKNIYHTGVSYRCRVSVNGKMHSSYFSSKRKAITWRNEMNNIR